jgi:hypothetical protein
LEKGIEMTEPKITVWLQRYHGLVGGALLATWLVYSITLFPMQDEFLHLVVFALAITVVGLLGAVLAIRGHRFWIEVSTLAAALLLVRYAIYWYGIRGNILTNAPDTNGLQIFGEIVKSGLIIFEHKLSQGEALGAALVLFNEFAMPLFQGLIVAIATVSLFAERQRRKERAGR